MLKSELYDLQADREPGEGERVTALSDRDRQLIRWMKQHLPATAQGRSLQIVELGCGDGTLSVELASALSAQVLGMDIAAAHVARARAHARGAANVEFRVVDFDTQLSAIESASADSVVSLDVLEHVFDVFGFVANIARILRPGGLAVLRVPNIAYVRHRASLLRGALPVTSSWFGPSRDLTAWRTKWGWDGGHLHYFTLDTLRQLLLDAGLRPLGFRDPGARLAGLRAFAPGLLAGNLAALARK